MNSNAATCSQVALLLLLLLAVAVHAFSPVDTSSRKVRSRTFLQGRSSRGIPRRKPGEMPWEYQRRLSEALANPTMFEETTTTVESGRNDTDGSVVKRTSGYQRIEEWDEEKRRTATAEVSWEERVQMDGLRHGNGLVQNEILRRNMYR
eukprot:CAMPEP_0194030362 /NCGR_PEP_ID=MMETSP0009_2-20130614/3884_1 /TAXON_ID=210454 /ORGANISM="Grammatophora oceanica, Strain CCMP 410" /LENGTH=148 /DNA_ID=CAMNT_0038670301 /DNA_START=130 /DNA_END=576 /DNA_ORIENTATION=-